MKNNFYTKEEQEERIKYIPTVKQKILEKLEDLKYKIQNNEPCPEKEQDIDMLVEIDDYIDNCLNNWYY